MVDDADSAPPEEPDAAAAGLPDWLWAPLLTVALAALLYLVGADSFAA